MQKIATFVALMNVPLEKQKSENPNLTVQALLVILVNAVANRKWQN
jgi:hypothetical protein